MVGLRAYAYLLDIRNKHHRAEDYVLKDENFTLTWWNDSLVRWGRTLHATHCMLHTASRWADFPRRRVHSNSPTPIPTLQRNSCMKLASYPGNRMATRSIPNKEFYVIITRKITRVSNFPRILGNYAHAQTVVTRCSLFPSHRTPGYEASMKPAPCTGVHAHEKHVYSTLAKQELKK